MLETTILGAIALDYYLFGSTVPIPFALLVPLSVALLFGPTRAAVVSAGIAAGLAGVVYLGLGRAMVWHGAVILDAPAMVGINFAFCLLVVAVSLAIWVLPTHWLLRHLRRQNRRLRRENRRARAAERAARESAALLQAVMDSTPDAIAVLDPQGGYRFRNTVCGRLLDRDDPSPVGVVMQTATAQVVATGQPYHQEITLPTEPPSRWTGTWLPWRDADGHLQGVISIAHDTTARRDYEQQLAHLASHDALTGLPNRQALELALALPPGSPPATLLFIDLDHFNLVNDTLGHAAGDQVLVALAARLAEGCGPDAVLVRLGGDEFGVFLPHTSIEAAWAAAEQLRAAVAARPFTLAGQRLELSVSIGVVGIPAVSVLPAHAVAQGEIAMYRAKRQGGNLVQVAQPPDSRAPALTTVTAWLGRLKTGTGSGWLRALFPAGRARGDRRGQPLRSARPVAR